MQQELVARTGTNLQLLGTVLLRHVRTKVCHLCKEDGIVVQVRALDEQIGHDLSGGQSP